MAEIDSTDDGRVDLKKRARRRLVGAVALALLAVIVLPMVMDEAPKPLTQDIQIRIPSQDSAAPAARVPVPAPQVTAPSVADVKTDLKPETPSETKSESALASAKPAPPADPVKAVEEPKPQAVEAKPESKPETKSPAKADAQREQWVVQLGAYKEQGNVKLILSKVKELGYPAYTERVDSEHGVRTRVRAGPFATREKAERAQAALKRISAGGPSGGVVAPK